MATVDELRQQLTAMEKQISSVKAMAAAGVPGMAAQVTMLQNMYNTLKMQYSQAVQAQQAAPPAYTAQTIQPAPRATIAPRNDEVVRNSSTRFQGGGASLLGRGASVGGGIVDQRPARTPRPAGDVITELNLPNGAMEQFKQTSKAARASGQELPYMNARDMVNAGAYTPSTAGAGADTTTFTDRPEYYQETVNGRVMLWWKDPLGSWDYIDMGPANPDGTSSVTETEAERALRNAQADYYRALAEQQSSDAANQAAQLAWQQEQWAQQLEWYKEQAALEAKKEADRLAAERQSYLSELAANPRQWIKYNIETTDQAGTTPGWLSQLFEGKVAEGASLDEAKAQGRFPILSKNWYNWLTPSEKEMMSGYISWAGTDPNDYWNNLWWMRGNRPQGAPRLAAIEQK